MGRPKRAKLYRLYRGHDSSVAHLYVVAYSVFEAREWAVEHHPQYNGSDIGLVHDKELTFGGVTRTVKDWLRGHVGVLEPVPSKLKYGVGLPEELK